MERALNLNLKNTDQESWSFFEIQYRTEYSYDQRNYLTQKRVIAGEFNYVHDGNGQLLSASQPNSPSESFTYDSLGNRITDNQGNYIYDAKLQRLTSDYQYTYLYDNNGNLTLKQAKDSQKESYKFNYSSSNQLIKIEILKGALGSSQLIKEISFKYDALGRRMQKTVKDLVSTDSNKTYTRNFIYNDENILFEFDGNNALLARHTHNPLTLDDVLSTQYSSSAVNNGIAQAAGNYYYHKDHLGSVIALSDSAGAVKQKYNYSSFGKILSITDGNNTDISTSPFIRSSFTYTGRELEEEASLYYYRARFYDADIGRFIQQDPEPGKLNAPSSVINKYIYVGNAPLMFADPSGKFLQFLLFAFISAAIMTFYQSITGQVKGNQNIQETFLRNFAFAIVFGLFSQYAMGTSFIRSFSDMTFKEVAGIAINSGVSSAFKSGLISIFSHATGAPVMEMILIFGFMYLPDMPQDTKSELFDPPQNSIFDRK